MPGPEPQPVVVDALAERIRAWWQCTVRRVDVRHRTARHHVDLGPFGAAGKRAFADLWAAVPMATDADGLTKGQFRMPTATTLIGATTGVQCVVLAANANTLGQVTSAARDIQTRN